VSEGVRVALTTGIFVICAAVIGWFGVRYTVRSSAKALDEAAALKKEAAAAAVAAEKATAEAGSYVRAREALSATIGDLRTDVADLRAALAEEGKRHREQLTEQDQRHRQQIAELREERREQLTALNERLDEMEAKRDNDRRLIQDLNKLIESLNDYIRQLIRVLRDHRIVPPPAPPGMHFDTD
jgi:chromosome segregation ATPase